MGQQLKGGIEDKETTKQRRVHVGGLVGWISSFSVFGRVLYVGVRMEPTVTQDEVQTKKDKEQKSH